MNDHAVNRTNQRWSRPRARQQQQSYRAHHDRASAAKLSTTVLHALADAMGVDVTDSEFTLADSIDPDAFDRLFVANGEGTPRTPGHVAFCVEGYRITVYSDGNIVVTPPTHDTV